MSTAATSVHNVLGATVHDAHPLGFLGLFLFLGRDQDQREPQRRVARLHCELLTITVAETDGERGFWDIIDFVFNYN